MRPVVVIGGVSEGLGAAQARRFAAAGYDVLGLARSERAAPAVEAGVHEAGGAYRHVVCDLTRADELSEALRPEAGRIGVALHNAHRLLIAPFLETELAEFEQVWRDGCLSAASFARAALPEILAQGGGTLLFTGATAGLRGGARFAAFASAKFALRGLAQSLAREFGPQGVHVAQIVVDGLIDAPQTDRRFGAPNAEDDRLSPDAVAESCLHLAKQPRSAWTQELDLRPFAESF